MVTDGFQQLQGPTNESRKKQSIDGCPMLVGRALGTGPLESFVFFFGTGGAYNAYDINDNFRKDAMEILKSSEYQQVTVEAKRIHSIAVKVGKNESLC